MAAAKLRTLIGGITPLANQCCSAVDDYLHSRLVLALTVRFDGYSRLWFLFGFVACQTWPLLRFQCILLLGLFVKPLLVRQENSQSGGALYRGVVVRNVVCTASISATYMVATAVVVAALSAESSENNTVSRAINTR